MTYKEVQDLRLGLASVTCRGIVFAGITYSNAKLIKRRWFEAADKNGEWIIPVLYDPHNRDHFVIYDCEGIELASSVKEMDQLDIEVVQAYYDAINALKLKWFKHKS